MKEEQKQQIIDIMKADEDLGLYETKGKVLTTEEVTEGRSSKYEFIDFEKEEPKQETFEEAAREYFESNKYKSDYPHCPYSFTDGAKWETEKRITDKAIADIRNKMGYVSNLISLLALDVRGDWIEGRIQELIPKSKESIKWLKNIQAKDYENNN